MGTCSQGHAHLQGEEVKGRGNVTGRNLWGRVLDLRNKMRCLELGAGERKKKRDVLIPYSSF